MRRAGVLCLRQIRSRLKISLEDPWWLHENAPAKKWGACLPAGAGSSGLSRIAQMCTMGIHYRCEDAALGRLSSNYSSRLGGMVSGQKAASYFSSLSENYDIGRAIDSDGEFRSYNDQTRDEIVSQYEKLLQKWSSNTPLLLDNLQVQLNPIIVCRVLKKIPNSNAAKKFFDWAKNQTGFQHNVYTYTAMIDHYGRSQNYEAIEQLLDEMHEVRCGLSIVTFSSLMHWYRQAKNLACVRLVWQRMHNESCPPNEYTYTTYIDAVAKGGCHQEAMEAFKDMQESGCQPNIFTYTVLIHTLVEAGKLDGACELFERLCDLEHRPNSVTYTILLGAHVKAGDLEKALYFYKNMMQSGLTPSPSLRSLLSKAFITRGMVREAKELGQINAATAVENETQAGKVNSIHGCLPKPEKLAELLREWGPETERVLVRVKAKLKHPYLMNVLTLLSRDPEVACRFFEWLKAQGGYTPSKYMLTKVMDIVGKAGHTELQREILQKAEATHDASTVSYNTLIKSYCATKHTDAALQVFEHMKVKGFEPNAHTYTMLIDLLSRTRNHTHAMKMYGQMLKTNCKPTIHTYTVIIHSLARSGKVNAANTLFEKLPSLGIAPSTVTYTVLMQAFLKEQDTERALKLYKAMQLDGLTPSRATLRVITKGLHSAGRHDDADALLQVEPYFPDNAKAGLPQRAQKDVQSLLHKYFL